MFAHHFQDNLRGFGDALVATTPISARETPGCVLGDAEAFADLLARFCADRGCRDARAAASQWSKWFFSRLIIPVTVVQLATDRRLVCGWEDLAIGWHTDATPRCFMLRKKLFEPGEGADFSALIDRLLVPLVNALTGYCRLSPRVFWSNAAVYQEWALSELAGQRRIASVRVAAARALLDMRTRPDGGFNPFDQAYKDCAPGALDGNQAAVTRCRRLCCMRDLDAKWGLCANCPRALHFDCHKRTAVGG